MSEYSISNFSRFFLSSNVKGVTSVKTEYVYNFFTPNERVDEEGLSAVPGRVTSEIPTQNLESPDVEQTIPRYVRVDFNFFGDLADFSNSSIGDADLTANTDLKTAFFEKKICTEESIGSYDFKPYIYGNKQLEEVCDGFFRRLFTSQGADAASQLDLLKEIAKKYSIDANLLEDIMPSSLKGINLNYLEYSNSDIFSREELLSNSVVLNSAYAPFMCASSPMRGTSLYNFAAISRLKSAIDKQTENLNHLWSVDENIFNIPYLSVEKVDDLSFSPDTLTPVGFIFEKNRLFEGKLYPMPSIVISDPRARSFIDTEIAADMVYEYKPRAVYHVKVPMKATGRSEGWFILEFYIASESLAPTTINCTEAIRPLPPATVEFAYSIQSDRLRIDWRDVINDQQDIKYFQVFRRRYIEQPFELIAHLDFDDSIVRKKSDEKIDPNLILALDYRLNYFEDSGFDHDSDFIYAIVCKDARMLSSTYSAQYRVKYDLNSNKTIAELISEAGAPKEFPNYMLKNSSPFPAMIKNSSQSSVRVIFDPECLGYIRSTDLHEIGTDLFRTQKEDEESRFVFQFLNFDKIESDSIEVFVQSDREDISYTLDRIPIASNFQKHQASSIMQAAASRNPGMTDWQARDMQRNGADIVQALAQQAASRREAFRNANIFRRLSVINPAVDGFDPTAMDAVDFMSNENVQSALQRIQGLVDNGNIGRAMSIANGLRNARDIQRADWDTMRSSAADSDDE